MQGLETILLYTDLKGSRKTVWLVGEFTRQRAFEFGRFVASSYPLLGAGFEFRFIDGEENWYKSHGIEKFKVQGKTFGEVCVKAMQMLQREVDAHKGLAKLELEENLQALIKRQAQNKLNKETG